MLPDSYTRSDAVFNLSRLGVLLRAFETGDLTGWTPGGDSDYPANTEIDAKPSVTSDGDGQYTFNTYQWWAPGLTVSQTATVPSGIYDISAVVATWENREVTFSAGSETVTSTGLGDMTGIPVSISNLTIGQTTRFRLQVQPLDNGG